MESEVNKYQLTQKQKDFAASYLREDDATSAAKIQEIREWIENNDGLFARTDNFSILKFLRSCKFDIDKTKEKLHNYYTQRTQLPEWYADRNPFLSEMQEMFKLGVFLPLKELDDEGRLIIIIRTCVHNPSKHPIANVVKAGMMILDIVTRENVSISLHGVIAIFDMTGVTMSHGFQMTPTVIQQLVHSWQGCYPLRIYSLNIINAPIHVNVVLNIFKKFMTKKLQSKLHIHMKSSKKCLSKFPSHLLPNEYSGTGGPLQDLIDYWKNVVEENQDWLKEEEKYRQT